MPKVLNFYIDDSGTRHPDRHPKESEHRKWDWFALGGILIRESDEAIPRTRYDTFCAKWGITYPLHSYDIRHRSNSFRWLAKLNDKERNRFFRELEKLLLPIPVLGLACVIDRPGYNARYLEKYGRQRWSLCKSAFSIVVERAAKFAMDQNLRLRVMLERSSKKDDRRLQEYYEALKQSGAPFAPDTSKKYAPLSSENLRNTLYEFRSKNKSSPMIQIADLYLWPICMGGYDPAYDPYRKLQNHGRLMDCICKPEEIEYLGTKYYCFELAKSERSA